MDLITLSEHELLVFWTQLLVMLLAARTLGALMRAAHQPTVLGELLAGVLIGPSALGQLAPGVHEWLFPPGDEVQGAMLLTVGWIGVFLLLIDTGFETDLELIRAQGRAAISVTVGSLVVPLVAGVALGMAIPSSFVGEADDRLVFALFMAVSISITALAVMAKVLGDLGLTRRNVGQIMLAGGMANDAVGWLLLGAIAGLATSETLEAAELLTPMLGMAVFLVLALTVGQRLVDFMLRSLRRFDAGITGSLTVTVVVALAAGAITQSLGTEAVLGGFVAGLLAGRSKFQRPETRPHLEALTAAVFAPIFFATAGLRVDLQLLTEGQVAEWTVVVTIVAFATKTLGGFLGAKRAGLATREGLAAGLGLNCRGTLEIVVATVGLSLGVLNEASYTVILVMVLSTTAIAPPLLRLAVAGWKGTEEEQRRLERESELARNVVVRDGRLLLPSAGGPASRLTARLLHLVWPAGAEATVVSVGKRDGVKPDLDPVVAGMGGRQIERKHVGGKDAVDAILRQANLGYALIGLGVNQEERQADVVFSPLVDDLVGRSPLPLVITRLPRGLTEPPTSFRRILVPVSGTTASRAAQEVGFGIGAKLRTDTVVVHVTPTSGARDAAAAVAAEPTAAKASPNRRRRFRRIVRRSEGAPSVSTKAPAAARVVQAALAGAERQGAAASAMIRKGASTTEELVRCAKEIDADLVVIGASVREVDDHYFVGQDVDQILRSLDCTVLVVTVPPPRTPSGH